MKYQYSSSVPVLNNRYQYSASNMRNPRASVLQSHWGTDTSPQVPVLNTEILHFADFSVRTPLSLCAESILHPIRIKMTPTFPTLDPVKNPPREERRDDERPRMVTLEVYAHDGSSDSADEGSKSAGFEDLHSKFASAG
uniref:Uncharacterized protein n=1 Tax=Ananas comosus var. bracteatus TaxID=296719 RepID=A0A6V7Q0B0_ANACO|nr:unnamed protein product [Ananas comosus var. bracteatus]